jgi:hypothetical protein
VLDVVIIRFRLLSLLEGAKSLLLLLLPSLLEGTKSLLFLLLLLSLLEGV